MSGFLYSSGGGKKGGGLSKVSETDEGGGGKGTEEEGKLGGHIKTVGTVDAGSFGEFARPLRTECSGKPAAQPESRLLELSLKDKCAEKSPSFSSKAQIFFLFFIFIILRRSAWTVLSHLLFSPPFSYEDTCTSTDGKRSSADALTLLGDLTNRTFQNL